ncbi:MAG: hypothetical protein ACRDIC_07050, partial [bacterium]
MERSDTRNEKETGGPKVVWAVPPWAWRLRRVKVAEAPLLLALLLWLCTLPLVLLLVSPFFGLNTALIVAAVVLIAILLVCF